MTSPKIVNETFEDLLKKNITRAGEKVPEWKLIVANEKDPGVCLLKLFTHLQEDIYSRLNRVPDKNLKAFLEMVGIKASSSQPARVPITFYPASGFSDMIYVPEGTPLLSPKDDRHDAVGFETEKNFSVCDNQISHLFSINPADDEIYDHLPSILSKKPFIPFLGRNLQQHVLYLGHRQLFRVEGSLTVELKVDFQEPDSSKNFQNLRWTYVNDAGDAVDLKPVFEYSNGDKTVKIALTPSGKIKETEVNKKSSLWISVRSDSIKTIIPAIKSIKVLGVSSSENGSKANFAFYNFSPIDLGAEKIYPLGKEPKLYDSFFMSCKEVLSQAGSRITVEFKRSANEPEVKGNNPELQWEYYDGTVWRILSVAKTNFSDTDFKGIVEFECPSDLREGSVCGINGFWIKTTLVAGNWGLEKLRVIDEDGGSYCISDKSEIKPPWLSSITFKSNNTKKMENPLECCLAYNNLDFVDFTARSRGNEDNRGFKPFISLSDTKPALYIGFKNRFPEGNTSTYFSIKDVSEADGNHEVKWCYWLNPLTLTEKMIDLKKVHLSSVNGIGKGTELLFFEPGGGAALECGVVEKVASDGSIELKDPLDYFYSRGSLAFCAAYPTCKDNTKGLIRSEMLEFVGLEGLTNVPRFGADCYWIVGRVECLSKDPSKCLPMISAIYPNTVWASQVETIKNELLGSSDGEKSITLSFLNKPVASSEVWVKEGIVLSDSDKAILAAQKISFVDVIDNLGKAINAWIRWTEVDDLYSSGPRDRHYLLDAMNGTVTFGNGINGMIPPIGSQNIKATYKWGGGSGGNLPADDINILKVPIAGIEKIANNVASEGGSDMEGMSAFVERGPYRIRHRNRAVTLEDYIRIAKESHRNIARMKCIAKGMRIYATVIPNDPDSRPMPSSRLLESVKRTLLAQSQVVLSEDSIQMQSPVYIDIRVAADIIPTSIDLAVPLKKAIIEKLNAYLHPLTGGSRNEGWPFGRGVHRSEIYSLIQSIDGVSHVADLTLNDAESDIIIGESEMVCSGNHVVTMHLEA